MNGFTNQGISPVDCSLGTICMRSISVTGPVRDLFGSFRVMETRD